MKQSQKMDSVELNGSHVARSWTVFIDETEKMVKYIKENADFLASNTIDKINALYAVTKSFGKFLSLYFIWVLVQAPNIGEAGSRLKILHQGEY